VSTGGTHLLETNQTFACRCHAFLTTAERLAELDNQLFVPFVKWRRRCMRKSST